MVMKAFFAVDDRGFGRRRCEIVQCGLAPGQIFGGTMIRTRDCQRTLMLQPRTSFIMTQLRITSPRGFSLWLLSGLVVFWP
jgi:hypothetical protein